MLYEIRYYLVTTLLVVLLIPEKTGTPIKPDVPIQTVDKSVLPEKNISQPT